MSSGRPDRSFPLSVPLIFLLSPLNVFDLLAFSEAFHLSFYGISLVFHWSMLLFFLFPFSHILACQSGVDGPQYKYAGLMISTLNHECASTYLMHDVGIEYNSV